MSKHHHHPHEGHGSGKPGRKPIHHDWRYYAAAMLIMLALVLYLLSGDLSMQPTIMNTQAAPSAK
jgi:hypothetical protein